MFAALAALLAVALPVSFYERKREIPRRLLVTIELSFALVMELFTALFVTYSTLPGAAAFAGLALFTTTWYGFVLRVTPRAPWHALGSGVVFAIACALNPSSEHVAIFAVMGPIAVCAKMVAGFLAERSDQAQAAAEQLRAAVAAQILDDQSSRIAALADTLLDVVARNHDVRNAVMAATVGAETLQRLTEGDSLEEKRGTIDEIARNLEGSLERVGMLLTEISRLGRDELAEIVPEHVRVQPVLSRIVADVRRRFPSIQIELEAGCSGTTARVAGGEVTLARILENALVNACEGNGTEHASHVAVRVEADGEAPYLRLRVKDDGPGFAPELMDGPIRGFVTTKDGGTGLGLYTLERLTRASGGRVSRENDQGARVTIELLRSDGATA